MRNLRQQTIAADRKGHDMMTFWVKQLLLSFYCWSICQVDEVVAELVSGGRDLSSWVAGSSERLDLLLSSDLIH